jgi:hypothetical protein
MFIKVALRIALHSDASSALPVIPLVSVTHMRFSVEGGCHGDVRRNWEDQLDTRKNP